MKRPKFEEDAEAKAERERQRRAAELERGKAARSNVRGQALDLRNVYGRR